MLLLLSSVWACQPTETGHDAQLASYLTGQPRQIGKPEFLETPYVTAGDRVYMVGHQDGSFPDLGWHVTGEMGGIWDHPIKLMDGFQVAVETPAGWQCIAPAIQMSQFPAATQFLHRDEALGLEISRTQYAPDGVEGMVIEFDIKPLDGQARGVTLGIGTMIDLRPAWLGERTEMADDKDSLFWDDALQAFIGQDASNDWFTVVGADFLAKTHQIGELPCPQNRNGLGVDGTLAYDLKLDGNKPLQLRLFIAGSYEDESTAIRTFKLLQEQPGPRLAEKQDRLYEIAQRARINIPDADIAEAYEWLKYNTDWLIREVPEHGRALSAGIPDYPWWFGCDNTYTLQGVLATGRPGLMRSTLALLKHFSEKENGSKGRVVHEISTNGAVFNPGNTNETPHFTSMVWHAYRWTGDKDLLREYYPFCKAGMEWLLETRDEDGNLLPEGAGMMEIHGLESEMIDVAVYTEQALRSLGKMAAEMGDEDYARSCSDKAGKLRELILDEFWVPEFNSYADFISSRLEAEHLIEDAIVRADTLDKPWAVAELKETQARIQAFPAEEKRGFVVHHNWVVNTPLETGIAPKEQAIPALETASRFVNPFGVFVTGIDRDESAGTDDGSFAQGKKIFTYTGAVMTLPTGVQAIAEANYGRADASLDYLKRMVRSFSYAHPGSIYEVSPDFGMLVQAWNIYALATPIVEHYFGVKPRAYEEAIDIQPLLPSHWRNVSLEALPVGDNEISLFITRENNRQVFTLTQSRPDWTFRIALPGDGQGWQLNGADISPVQDGERFYVEAEGEKVIVSVPVSDE
ncbi:MAG: glycogen debranching protein [Bacteroidota bacterium]